MNFMERAIGYEPTDLLNFNCVEQSFNFRKAVFLNDPCSASQILMQRIPCRVRAIGRRIQPKRHSLEEWNDISEYYMKKALLAKFTQNGEIREFLFRTRGMEIAYAEMNDPFWGIGMDVNDENARHREHWNGLNRLGRLLNEVRDELWECSEYRLERFVVDNETFWTRVQKLENLNVRV